MSTAWIIVQADGTDVAFVGDALAERGLHPRPLRPFAGEHLPEPASLVGGGDVVVCLGGAASAYDTEGHPHLVVVQRFLAAAVADGVPVLGICLGSQLLAAALGGAAIPGDSGLECGYIEILDGGADHPLGRCLAGRWFAFHSDSFLLPPGAIVLARTERYLQAWTLGSALAIQFHPELSVPGVRRLAAGEERALARAGIDGTDLIAEAEREGDDARQRCAQLLNGWLEHATACALPTPLPD